jgi:hypothetical protein
MSMIMWLPFDEEHPYWPHLKDEFEKPEDGFELISQWIGEDAYDVNPSGKRARKYWLQLLGRGKNDRKALLTAFGKPLPPEITDEHIQDAASILPFKYFRWERKSIGTAWILPDESE